MSALKRKQRVPQKSSEEKRLKMTWNMFDLRSPESFVLSDATNSLLDENLRTVRQISNRKRSCNKKQKLTGDKGKQTSPCTLLRIGNYIPEDFICVLGSFELLAVPSEMKDFKSLLDNAELVHLQLENFVSATTLVTFSERKASNDKYGSDYVPTAPKVRAVVLNASDEQLQAVEYLEIKGILKLVKKEPALNQDNCLQVQICLCKDAITSAAFASEDLTVRKCDRMMKVIMRWLFPSIIPDDEIESSEVVSENCGSNFDDLYDAVKTIRESNLDILFSNVNAKAVSLKARISDKSTVKMREVHKAPNGGLADNSSVDAGTTNTTLSLEIQRNKETSDQKNQVLPNSKCLTITECDIQHPDLIPQLRGYQKKAVCWMLAKEQPNKNNQGQGKYSRVFYIHVWQLCKREDWCKGAMQ